jgi:hypothetical protein
MTIREYIAERLDGLYGDLIDDQRWDLAERVEEALLFSILDDQIDQQAEAILREQTDALAYQREVAAIR